MASSRPFIALSILLQVFALAAPAVAQEPGPGDQPATPAFENVFVNDTQVWSASRDVPGILYVTSTGHLTLDGATVRLRYLAVDPGATLVLKSEPGAPAGIGPADDAGWQGDVLGTMDARGLPDVPVRLGGLRGQGTRAELTIIFQGGFHLGGNATMENVIFENYTAGLMVAEGGHLDADHVAFGSRGGLGLVVHGGAADVTNAVFHDAGGGAFVTRKGGFLNLTDSAFDSAASPIVTIGTQVSLRNVSVSNSAFCVEAYAGTVSIDGFTCREFTKAGIRAQGGPNLLDITIEDADISTTNASQGQGHGIDLDRVHGATIERTRLGPLPGNGIVEKRTPVRIENVTAQGVGVFDEVVFDAPGNGTVEPRVQGDPGAAGWLEAYWTPKPKVLLPNGSPAPNATVVYNKWRTQDPVFSQTVNEPNGSRPGTPMRALLVVPNGTKVVVLYTVVAKSEDGNLTATLDFTPNADELVLQLQPPSTGGRRVPGATFAFFLVGVALLAGARRRGT